MSGTFPKVFLLWAVWAAVTLLVAAGMASLPVSTPGGWGPELTRIAPPLARWDSGWYYGIATEGYRFDAGHPQNSIGFYPLYPLVVRGAAELFHAPVFETGIAVSLVALLGALAIVARLTAEWGSEEAAVPIVACLLLFPGSFYLAAFYSESLFLLATAAALLAARKRAWIWAGVAGAAACLTRFNGFLVALPVLACMGGERRETGGAGRRIACGALLAAGAAAFPAYLWRRWGDPLLYFHDKAAGWPSYRFGQFWRAFGRLPLDLVRHAGEPGGTKWLVTLAEALALLLALAGAIYLVRRRLFPEALYVAATIALVSLSGSFESFPRYALGLLPAFLLPAVLARRSLTFAFLYSLVGCGLGAVLMSRFIHWIYVG